MIHLRICALIVIALVWAGCVSNTKQSLTIISTQSPADGNSREPELTPAQNDGVILSWVEMIRDDRYALRMSTLEANGWSETRTVAEGENWFINWADFPSVIALNDGTLAAHWLVKSGKGTYAYDVNISMSKDGGRTWTKPLVPHRDNTQTEHGFVSLIPLSDGRLGATWLDGRNMKNMKETDEHAPAPESMILRYATIDANGNLSDETQLDERVCECCQTSAAITANGPIIVYRDRSATEVRDIYIVRRLCTKTTHVSEWILEFLPTQRSPQLRNPINVSWWILQLRRLQA